MASSRSERGQAILLFVGIFSVILVMAAIVIDFGLWFAERRSAQRGADLAAAAAAQDLPDEPLLAFDAACDWAEANGYAEDVFVAVFTRGDDPDLTGCATPITSCSAVCDTVRVTVSKGAPQLFTALPFFGIDDFDVGAVAVAGLTYGGGGGGVGGVGADQTIVLIDAEGRMGKGFAGENCRTNPQACPIGNERSAATGMVDTLLGLAGNGEVGYAPYHNCYGPASSIGPGIGCVPDRGDENVVIEPTRDSAALHAAIDSPRTGAYQLQAANICTGLSQAELLFDTPGGRRVLVLMSGGDNLDYATFNESGGPPAACIPSPSINFGYNPPCSASRPAESELDYLTLQMATQLKNQGVEIYVIGLNPCAWADASAAPVDIPWQPGDCELMVAGHNIHDNDADQRLLMCIATSPEHYQRVNNVAELPDTIEDIASDIVSRSLLQ